MDEICRSLRAGASLHIAADAVAIPYKTVLGWRAMGEEARSCEREGCADPHHGPAGADTSYELFATAVQQATGQCGLRAVASISAQFPSDPRYAERWLARRYAADFGLAAELRQDGTAVAPFVITIVPNDRPAAETDELMRDLAAIPGRTGDAGTLASATKPAAATDEDEVEYWTDPQTGKAVAPDPPRPRTPDR